MTSIPSPTYSPPPLPSISIFRVRQLTLRRPTKKARPRRVMPVIPTPKDPARVVLVAVPSQTKDSPICRVRGMMLFARVAAKDRAGGRVVFGRVVGFRRAVRFSMPAYFRGAVEPAHCCECGRRYMGCWYKSAVRMRRYNATGEKWLR